MRTAFVMLLLVGIARAEEKPSAEDIAKAKLFFSIAFSAKVCGLGVERRLILKRVETEKKYSRIGGVVDLRKMRGLQEELRAVDDAITETKAKVRGKLPLFACTDKRLNGAIGCWTRDKTVWCDDSDETDLALYKVAGDPPFEWDDDE